MIDIQKVKAFAEAEIRVSRRLVRYWFFLSISYLTAIIFFLIYSGFHGVYSYYSATAAVFNPRFLVGTIGFYYLMIYIVGIIFLGFDVRARDQREQMIEVLDSRPYSNLELVLGRFLGLLLASWIPIIVKAVILELLGLILIELGTPLGGTIEIYSLFTFVFLMALPALAFVLSLVFLVTLLVRNRLIAAVVLLALIGGNFWAILNLPSVYSPLVDLTGSTILNNPSDIIPALTDLKGWLQRTGVLLAALGILGFSAAVHPRLSGDSRSKSASGGFVLIILALSMTGFGFFSNINSNRVIDTWKEAHATLADAPLPDIRFISGKVKVEPGKALDLDLRLTFSAPDHETLKKAVFTLNPGQKVKRVVDASGQPLNFKHENGLLELELSRPLDPGKEAIIQLSIDGLPDRRFGYLESSVSTENMNASQRNLSILGLERYIFDSRFVALMPGIQWLPTSGTEKNRCDPTKRAVDYFNVDLIVDLPSGWLAAGPGRRHKMEAETDRVKFRFSPGSPVPEVALIASKFISRSFEIEGINMEILVYPGHMKNIELMAETGEKIRTWIGERLKEAREYGLPYPYDGLTLVEVPNSLRSFGGGWRMDTTMAPPGLLLMREKSFPTARFDWPFRDPDIFKNREGGLVQAKWESLQTFFNNDVSGGNVYSGAARNFFLNQVNARGQEAIALNFVMEILSSLLITETGSYFSAHSFTEDDILGPIVGLTIISQNNNSPSRNSMTDSAIDIMASSPEIWERTLKLILKDMNLWKAPGLMFDALTLKAVAMARCILDILGREKTAQLLSSLRYSHTGYTFSLNDIEITGKTLGFDFNEIFGDWLDTSDLPGFLCPGTDTYRLPDSKDGMPRYQLVIWVHNDEPVSGVFRFRYQKGSGENKEWIKTEPIIMKGKSAARYGMVLPQIPEAIWLAPYISLNQVSFMIPLGQVDHEKIKNVEAIEGLKELPWSQPDGSFIIIDDLDEGFGVVDVGEKKDVVKGTQAAAISLNDKGLSTSTFYNVSPEWSRLNLPGSWGKYRHTATVIKGGDGKKKAVFIVEIINTGTWDLELHMPDKKMSFPGMKFGNWSLLVEDSTGGQQEISFNSGAALPGWNLAGLLDLPKGKVSVILSDVTDGDLVVADAVRWTPSVAD